MSENREHIAIDLRYLRPLYTDAQNSEKHFPLRMCAQLWDGMLLNCCNCDALLLDTENPMISMPDLVYGVTDAHIPQEYQTAAALLFAQALKDSPIIGDKDVVGIIPDYVSEFELSLVRSQLSMRFSSVDVLPASIAAVFDWSRQLHSGQIHNGDMVIVVDISLSGELLLIPIKAIEEHNLIVWERYPSVILSDCQFDESFRDALLQCHLPESMMRFPGLSGMLSEIDKLVINTNNHWYPLTQEIEKRLHNFTVDNKLLENKIHELEMNYQTYKAVILLACPHIQLSMPHNKCMPCNGAYEWKLREQEMRDVSLWYDYLPELSMEIIRNKRFERLALVGGENCSRITPIRGKKQSWEIDNFIMPPRKKTYTFPLFQGNGSNSEMRFNAVVHSRSFPLTKEEKNKLTLTYTYGEANPYELVFKGNYGTARTTWERSPEPSVENPGPIPKIYRKAADNSILEQCRNPDESDKINLFDEVLAGLKPRVENFIEGKFDYLLVNKKGDLVIKFKCQIDGEECRLSANATEFCEELPCEIKKGDPIYIARIVRWDDKLYPEGICFTPPIERPYENFTQEYAYPPQKEVKLKEVKYARYPKGVEISYNNKRYYIPRESCLCSTDDILNWKRGDVLYGSVYDDKNGSINIRLVSEKRLNKVFLQGYLSLFEKKSVDKIENCCWRIWKHRRNNQDLPPEFVKEYKRRINAILKLSHNLENRRKRGLWQRIICCMGAETPAVVRERTLSDYRRDARKNIPFAIARLVNDMSIEWQQTVFKEIVNNLQDDENARVLSRRACASILFNHELAQSMLSEHQIKVLLDFSYQDLGRVQEVLKNPHVNEDENVVKEVKYAIDDNCKIVSSLVTSRNHHNRNIRSILCLHSDWCRKLLHQIKDLHNALVDSEWYNRLEEVMQKQSEVSKFAGMYKPLYNLYQLLSGDDGAMDITLYDEDENIVEIEENDE